LQTYGHADRFGHGQAKRRASTADLGAHAFHAGSIGSRAPDPIGGQPLDVAGKSAERLR
jgi:hypothetical protein